MRGNLLGWGIACIIIGWVMIYFGWYTTRTPDGYTYPNPFVANPISGWGIFFLCIGALLICAGGVMKPAASPAPKPVASQQQQQVVVVHAASPAPASPDTKYCPACGQVIKQSAKFCEHCGAGL